MNKNTADTQALSPAKLHILLGLAGEEMHGYKIIKKSHSSPRVSKH